MKLPIPDDWDESNGYQIMLVCVPRSVQWTAIAKGAIYELTRGRNWDEETGIILDVQSVAREIWEGVCMATCDDILTVLNRIANSMDGGNSRRYTIPELQQALSEIGGGFDVSDFTDILEFVTVLTSKLPSLQHSWSIADLVTMAMTSRFRASQLNYLEDISLSQRGINISTGGLPNQLIYENLGDLFNAGAAGVTGGQSAGVQWLWQVVKGKDIQVTQDFLDLFNWLVSGSVRDGIYSLDTTIDNKQEFDYSVVFGDMVTELINANPNANLTSLITGISGLTSQMQSGLGAVSTDLQSLIDVTGEMSECVCAGGNGCSCGASEGVAVFEQGEISHTSCEAPAGFVDWDDYFTYSKSFTCWIIGKLVGVVGNVSNYEKMIYDFIQSAEQGTHWSVTELYNRVANTHANILPQTIRYNIPVNNLTAMTTAMTGHLSSMLGAIEQGFPETPTSTIVDDYLVNPSLALISELDSLANSGWAQNIVESANSTEAVIDVNSWIEQGFLNAIDSTYSEYESLREYFKSITSRNVSNYRYNKISEISDFTDTCYAYNDPCVGGGS